MNYQQILSLVLTLVGKQQEIVAVVKDAIALWDRVKGIAPQLTEVVKGAGAQTPAVAAPTMSITWLQESLNKLVDAKLTVDGKYGQGTQDAVKKFQAANGLTADGWAGVQTQAAIVSALNAVK